MKKKINTSSRPAVKDEIVAAAPCPSKDKDKRNGLAGSIEDLDEELENIDDEEEEEEDRYRRGGIYEDDIDDDDGSKQDGRFTMLNY